MRAAASAVVSVPARERCPLCGDRDAGLFLDRDAIEAELAMRDEFFVRRIARDARDLRDVTDVLLGTQADILRCDECSILLRSEAPSESAFHDDRYDDRLLRSLHAAHDEAFRSKDGDYRSLLAPGARVLEVGSYVGGFLTAARRWGWNVIGCDIGTDVTRFTRAMGFDVRARSLEECAFADESFDAIFVWNCFEQLAAPRALIAEARRVLRDFGILVLRVPDADFYVCCETKIREQGMTDALLAMLAYNGLLGWPHRFGYGVTALRALVGEDFELLRVLQRSAIRPFRSAMLPWAKAEESAIINQGAVGWIELTFRKVPN